MSFADDPSSTLWLPDSNASVSWRQAGADYFFQKIGVERIHPGPVGGVPADVHALRYDAVEDALEPFAVERDVVVLEMECPYAETVDTIPEVTEHIVRRMIPESPPHVEMDRAEYARVRASAAGDDRNRMIVDEAPAFIEVGIVEIQAVIDEIAPAAAGCRDRR